MSLFTGIGQLVLPNSEQVGDTPLRVLNNAFLWSSDGRVVATGTMADIPNGAPPQRINLGGRAVIPGLIDSHTHLCFAGHRIADMARRTGGEAVVNLAPRGGVAATARSVADADETALVELSAPRLRRMLDRGVTTCEIKSGYGQTPEMELKQLRAIRRLAAATRQSIRTTVLAQGAPASPQLNVDTFCTNVLEMAANHSLAQNADANVAADGCSHEEVRQIATAALAAGMGLKLHVDRFVDGCGAQLAAELGALSADHLEHVSPAGRAALAASQTVATLLPGNCLFSRGGAWSDGRALRDAGCTVAVASDYNPESCMVDDLLFCATLAVTQCGLTMEEALWSVTRGGAKALGLRDRGCLAVGERADLVVLEHDDWRATLYYPNHVPIYGVVINGAWAMQSSCAKA